MTGSWEPFGTTRRQPEPSASPAAPSAVARCRARSPAPPRAASRRGALAIITCMDARIDPLAVLGLRLGDANVLRNAGATVSDDVLRSLRAAASSLGVRRAVDGHTARGPRLGRGRRDAMAEGARRIQAPEGAFGVEPLMYDVARRARRQLIALRRTVRHTFVTTAC